MNALFEYEVLKIKHAANNISQCATIIKNSAPNSTFDLTLLDLRQAENSLHEAADKIANIRIRMERKEAPAKTVEQHIDF